VVAPMKIELGCYHESNLCTRIDICPLDAWSSCGYPSRCRGWGGRCWCRGTGGGAVGVRQRRGRAARGSVRGAASIPTHARHAAGRAGISHCRVVQLAPHCAPRTLVAGGGREGAHGTHLRAHTQWLPPLVPCQRRACALQRCALTAPLQPERS
jgi:hypothetical protein